jgi:hypothetical protein
LVKFVTDKTIAESVDLLANPENATLPKLVEVFATTGDASGKQLLVFDDVSSFIDTDIALANNALDPEQFVALTYAVTLAKLSLLQSDELNRLVRVVGGYGNEQPDVFPPATSGRFTLLLGAVRSIDGNHQWQPYGLPYPRTIGAPQPEEPGKRHFGYDSRDGTSKGFLLFIDPEMRQRVFSKIFPKPLAGKLSSRPELQAPRYPFPACDAHPFPVSFLPDGSPAMQDLTCSPQPQ